MKSEFKMYLLIKYIIKTTKLLIVSYIFSDLWLDWIKDEIAIVTTNEEKDNIIKLFEKAVKDYLSN